jgi:hypothetical protein
VGLTSTDPIDADYDNQLVYRDLYITTNGGGGGGGTANPHGISGTMSGTGGIKASDATFTPSEGVYCTYDANSFECVYDGAVVISPSITITGYRKGKDAWVCDTSGQLTPSNSPATGTAVIDLTVVGESTLTDIHLSFQDTSCATL